MFRSITLFFLLLLIGLAHGVDAYTGRVASIDLPAQIITVKSGATEIRFDLSNPVLKGYRSIAQISRGDTIQIDYTAAGVRVSKLSGRSVDQGKPVAKPNISVATPGKPGTKVPRVRPRGNEFENVDANKDGKITPVELSAVIPGLTMEQFKKCDVNGDGWLNKSEFRALQLPK